MKNILGNIIDPEKFNDPSYRKSTKFIGDILEIATAVFQEYEVSKSYNPKNLEYTIETKKIMKGDGGSRLEIDVFVEVHPGGSEAHSKIVILECKNLGKRKKIGKSHVSNFKDKIREVNKLVDSPVSGVIVGKAFTRDALKACQAKESNIRSLIVQHSEIDDLNNVTSAIFDPLENSANFIFFLENGESYGAFENRAQTTYQMGERAVDLREITQKYIDYPKILRRMREKVAESGEEGIHEGMFETESQLNDIKLKYGDGEFKRAEKIKAIIGIKLFYSKGKLLSKFDFGNDRRVIIREMKTASGKIIPTIISV